MSARLCETKTEGKGHKGEIQGDWGLGQPAGSTPPRPRSRHFPAVLFSDFSHLQGGAQARRAGQGALSRGSWRRNPGVSGVPITEQEAVGRLLSSRLPSRSSPTWPPVLLDFWEQQKRAHRGNHPSADAAASLRPALLGPRDGKSKSKNGMSWETPVTPVWLGAGNRCAHRCVLLFDA